jgi:hypothetical protein
MAKGFKSGGRIKGTPNKVGFATRARIETEADPIGFLCKVANGEPIACAPVGEDEPAAVLPSLDQRITAAQTLAKKVQPDARDVSVRIDLPAVVSAGDAMAAAGSVLGAVARGEITPSEGQALSSMVEAYRRTIETVELERRIAALEQRGALGG